MLYGSGTNRDNDMNEFHQRIADQNMPSIEERQDEIQHAKNGFIGMLAGIIVGGIVGWLFLGPTNSMDKDKEIPVIRRPITPAKVQPNEPGGMEIDNQNREIYHIVDNIPQEKEEVKIIPAPEMPKLIIENNITAPENIENLVEHIEEETNIQEVQASKAEEKLKVADTNLVASKTNSNDKIIIPNKIKDIEIKLQKSINSQSGTVTVVKEEKPATTNSQDKLTSENKVIAAKGTWYNQIIASSSRTAVDRLWQQLSSKHSFLKEYSHEIEEITTANGSTLYRLKVGAFKTRKEAETLSNKLKQNQISSIIKQN